MKTKLQFDELNSFDAYYEPMQIDIGSKARRRELAEYLTDAFVFFFAVFDVHKHYHSLLEKQLYQQLLADRVSEAVAKVTGIDSYMSNHIKELSKEVVNTTFKNATKTEVEPENKVIKQVNVDPYNTARSSNDAQINRQTNNPYPASLNNSPKESSESRTPPQKSTSDGSSPRQDLPDDTYWLSYKRAEDIAKNESNTFLNYTDYVEAVDSGYTQKRWLTMLDDKVRQTHSEVEGATIGIDEVFHVGNSLMKFPHDLSESPDPKEVIGCRCAVEYLR